MTTWDLTSSSARSAVGRTKVTAEEYTRLRRRTRQALDSAQLASGSVLAAALASFADEHDGDVGAVGTATDTVTDTGDLVLGLYEGGDDDIAGEFASRLNQAKALGGRLQR